MTHPTLLFGAALAALSAGIYFYVGRVLSRRRQSSAEAATAWRMFVMWWYALAGATLSGSLLNLLGAFGIEDLALFTTFTILNLLVTCAALFGLIFYLLYLYTGLNHLFGPLAAFYFFYYALLIYYVQVRIPNDVNLDRWTVALEFENPIPGPLFLVALLFLFVPQLIGSLAYFMLYFQVREPTQKYRILLVSWSIFIWFMSGLLAGIAGLAQYDWWQIVSRLIGLGAALIILFAYRPPSWIKRRFGIAAIAEGG